MADTKAIRQAIAHAAVEAMKVIVWVISGEG